MNSITPTNCPAELLDLSVDDARWRAHPLSHCDTKTLISHSIETLSLPLASKNSSFILHAPLELQARVALLQKVSELHRPSAQKRIAEIAIRYVHEDERIEIPVATFSSVDHAHDALRSALEIRDVGQADAAVFFLAASTRAKALRTLLTDATAPFLAAAGHTPILLARL